MVWTSQRMSLGGAARRLPLMENTDITYAKFNQFVESKALSVATKKDYLRQVRHLARFYPDKSLSSITETQVFDYLVHRRDDLEVRPATLNQGLVAIRSLYRDLLTPFSFSSRFIPPILSDTIVGVHRLIGLGRYSSIRVGRGGIRVRSRSYPSAKRWHPSAKRWHPSAKRWHPSAKRWHSSAKRSYPSAKWSYPSPKRVVSECEVVVSECEAVASECKAIISECEVVVSECEAVASECKAIVSEREVVVSERGGGLSECEGGLSECEAVFHLCGRVNKQ